MPVAGLVPHPTNQVCCSAKCGLCGGHGCSGRPGGPKECCMPAILRRGIICRSRADVACILQLAASSAPPARPPPQGSAGPSLRQRGPSRQGAAANPTPATVTAANPTRATVRFGIEEAQLPWVPGKPLGPPTWPDFSRGSRIAYEDKEAAGRPRPRRHRLAHLGYDANELSVGRRVGQ